jgi:hypothetical protein
MYYPKLLLFLTFILFLSCSENTNDDVLVQNCSPDSELGIFEINGHCREFNIIDGKSLNHIDDDNKTFFYETNFSEDFVIERMEELNISKKTIDNLYRLELFIEKKSPSDEFPILGGRLVSAIVHYKDNYNNLRVKYFGLEEDLIKEIPELRKIVPYVSASSSYLNFKQLKQRGIITNSYSLYNPNLEDFNETNAVTFTRPLTEYLSQKNYLVSFNRNDEPVFDDGTSDRCDSSNNQCNGDFDDTCRTQGSSYECSNGSGGTSCTATTITSDLEANEMTEESSLLSGTFESLYQFESFLSESQKGQQMAGFYWLFSDLTSNGTVSLSLQNKIDIAIFVSNNIYLINDLMNGNGSNVLYDSTKSTEIQNFLISLRQLSSNSDWVNLFDTIIAEIRYYENQTINTIRNDF